MSNTPVGKEGTPLEVNMVPVESSTIAAVGYVADDQVLVVEFKSGGRYLYHGVAPEKHAALIAAPSKGRYLHQHIKPLHTVSKVAPKEEG